MHSGQFDTAIDSTQTRITPKFNSMDEYIRKCYRSLVDIGIKIKDRNIFWLHISKDIETLQYGFCFMVGEWTLIDFITKGRYA